MSVKARLRTIVNGTDTWAGRAFDWVIIVLICYAIATLTYETVPALSENARQFLWISEVVVTALFTLEYGVRCYLAERKRDYLFSFYGIIDFVAVLPFYLALFLGTEVVVLRAFRAFRLLPHFSIAQAVSLYSRRREIAQRLIGVQGRIYSVLLHDPHPALHLSCWHLLLRAPRSASGLQFHFAFLVVGRGDADNGRLWRCVPGHSRRPDIYLHHPLDWLGRGGRACWSHCERPVEDTGNRR